MSVQFVDNQEILRLTESGTRVQIEKETSLWALLLQADQTNDSRSDTFSLIFFHGSGKSTSLGAYSVLLPRLRQLELSMLLYDRRGHGTSGGSYNQSPTDAAKDLTSLLIHTPVPAPYILVAHSSGGAVAKAFLYQRPQDVAAMVLIETGQETKLPDAVENQLYRWGGIMGSRPISVIRGNSFRDKFDDLARGNADDPKLHERRKDLEAWDAEDERLKRTQLKLSRKARFVNVRRAGHGVIADRADVVADEISHVAQQVQAYQEESSLYKMAKGVRNLFSREVVEVYHEG